MFPLVDQNDNGDGEEFSKSVVRWCYSVFEAIDHQQTDGGIGENFSQIQNVGGRSFSFREQEKGEKTGGHGPQNDDNNGDDLLVNSHLTASFSLGRFR